MLEWSQVKDTPRDQFAPGVYQGMPYETYAALPGLNYSKLKTLLGERTLAHARWESQHPTESKAKNLGHALHVAVLEPHRFDDEMIVAPDDIGDRRFKENKAKWKQFEALAGDKVRLTPTEGDCVKGVQASLAEHPMARALIYENKGLNELTILWDIPRVALGLEEGPPIRVKARIDRYTFWEGWPIVLDLKSFGKLASRFNWERDAHKMGYWIQAAMYLDAVDAMAPYEGEGFRRFWWLVAETEAPYCIRLFEADEGEPLDWGRNQWKKLVRTWVQASDSGVWSGWPQGVEVVGLPGWVYKVFGEEG